MKFDLEQFIQENKNPTDDPMLAVGISAGIKVGFHKAREVIAEELKENLAKWDKPLLYLHEIHTSIKIAIAKQLEGLGKGGE